MHVTDSRFACCRAVHLSTCRSVDKAISAQAALGQQVTISIFQVTYPCEVIGTAVLRCCEET